MIPVVVTTPVESPLISASSSSESTEVPGNEVQLSLMAFPSADITPAKENKQNNITVACYTQGRHENKQRKEHCYRQLCN